MYDRGVKAWWWSVSIFKFLIDCERCSPRMNFPHHPCDGMFALEISRPLPDRSGHDLMPSWCCHFKIKIVRTFYQSMLESIISLMDAVACISIHQVSPWFPKIFWVFWSAYWNGAKMNVGFVSNEFILRWVDGATVPGNLKKELKNLQPVNWKHYVDQAVASGWNNLKTCKVCGLGNFSSKEGRYSGIKIILKINRKW